MNSGIEYKLNKLKTDYYQNIGQSFDHFFCPIMFKDEDVELCKAHVINQAFPNSSRAWTVQRKDIDGFFGANFEADSFAVLYKENQFFGDTITDRKLSNLFKPEILLDGNPVDFFKAQGEVPANFTRIEFDNEGELVHLDLKMSPENVQSFSDHEWEFFFEGCENICFSISN